VPHTPPPWLGKKIPRGFFSKMSNKRLYFDWIAEQEGFKSMESWYNMKRKFFEKYPGGSVISNHYGGSPRRAIVDIYPDYDWKTWKFTNVPPNYWKDDDNCKKYLKWASKELNIEELDDWYGVGVRDFTPIYGSTLVQTRFNGSTLQLLKHFFPEHDWLEFKFSSVAKGYWYQQENWIRYLEWLGGTLGYTSREDWYAITQEDFANNYGASVLDYTDGSPPKVVMKTFPDHDWLPWKFNKTPFGYWDDKENHRKFMNWLGGELGFENPEDWYQIQGSDFNYGTRKTGLSNLIDQYYDQSHSKAVMAHYPEYEWKEWLFKYTPNDFWKNSDARRRYMDWLGKKLGYNEPEDWYAVSREDFHQNYGEPIFRQVEFTLISVLREYMPNYNWLPWKFNVAPMGYWKDEENQLEYLEWLSGKIGIEKLEDWFKINPEVFHENFGGGLLSYYGHSIKPLLRKLYPHYNWLEWRFSKVKPGFWDSKTNRSNYIKWFGEQIGINELDQWYDLDRNYLRTRGYRISSEYILFQDLIMETFPEHNWEEEKFSNIGKNERLLGKFVAEIFPNNLIKYQFRHSELRFSESGHKMELDIWIPELKLAFEYQGEQHFEAFHRGITQVTKGQSLESQQKRDQEKRKACEKLGIRLIEIPFTWNATKECVENYLS